MILRHIEELGIQDLSWSWRVEPEKRALLIVGVIALVLGTLALAMGKCLSSLLLFSVLVGSKVCKYRLGLNNRDFSHSYIREVNKVNLQFKNAQYLISL